MAKSTTGSSPGVSPPQVVPCRELLAVIGWLPLPLLHERPATRGPTAHGLGLDRIGAALGNLRNAHSLEAILNSDHPVAWRRGLNTHRDAICLKYLRSLALLSQPWGHTAPEAPDVG